MNENGSFSSELTTVASANPQTLLQQALQHHQAGRLAPAASLYAQVRKLLPASFDAFHLGGVAALQLQKFAEAADLLRKAVQLNARNATTHMCLGLALGYCGRRAEAESSLREAVRLDPANVETWLNLASVLSVAGKLDEAAEVYRRALRVKPDSAQGWSGLGSVLQLQGRAEEALAHHTRALQLDPLHPKAQSSRAQALQGLHRISEALADFEAHLRRQPGDLEAASYRLMLLNYSDTLTRAQLFEEHRAFGRRAASLRPTLPRSAFRSSVDPRKRLRVAILSPDLRGHSVTYFLEPLLQHLPESAFELYLYHDHFSEDPVSRRLSARAAKWRNFVGQTDDAVAAEIRADQPDLLLDLAGHTGFNRLALLGQRLAPVQITYLGYPNTTGLPAMDYRFTDPMADPLPESAAFHTEKPVAFSECAWTYAPPVEAGPLTPLPCAAGAPFTFGSFNSLSKVNDRTLRLWAQVLNGVQNARLLVKSLGVQPGVLEARAAAAGLPRERLEVVSGTRGVAEHLACYGRVDVALDPFPYHGTTTTCEALWMGVPVISLQGDRHASRVGASLLHAVGHPEWLANDEGAYVAIARQLAADPSALSATRAALRGEMQRSVLLDHAGQSARFAAALRACWQEYCAAPAA